MASSQSIIAALEAEHDIWQVARYRDAMAWLRHHQPQTVCDIDLDLDGLDAEPMLNAIESVRSDDRLIIGLSRNPSQIAPADASRFDQLICQ